MVTQQTIYLMVHAPIIALYVWAFFRLLSHFRP